MLKFKECRICLCSIPVVLALAVYGNASATTWTVPTQFSTMQQAIDSPVVLTGDTISVLPGYYAGATVTKAVKIIGRPGTVINSGVNIYPSSYPAPLNGYEAGFLFPGAGVGSQAAIKHFTFRGIEFPVFSRGADGVKVAYCTMRKPIQGVTNWGGKNWKIKYNLIKSLRTSSAAGGGIGIFIGDYQATAGGVGANAVRNNRIIGYVRQSAFDPGGYLVSGISLYADFRSGGAGAQAMSGNIIRANTVDLVLSVLPWHDIAGVEICEAQNPNPAAYVVTGNVISGNDLTAMANRVAVNPVGLRGVNTIVDNAVRLTLLEAGTPGSYPFR